MRRVIARATLAALAVGSGASAAVVSASSNHHTNRTGLTSLILLDNVTITQEAEAFAAALCKEMVGMDIDERERCGAVIQKSLDNPEKMDQMVYFFEGCRENTVFMQQKYGAWIEVRDGILYIAATERALTFHLEKGGAGHP